jgi:hypothetical protein
MTLALTKRITGAAVGLAVGTLLALAAPLTYAQTTTPGVPETGAGGDPILTLFVLAISGVLALLGSTYLARTKKA